MARTPLFKSVHRAVCAEAKAAGLELPAQSALSRRRFLQMSAGAAAAGAFTIWADGTQTAAARAPFHNRSVAIVGGGAAGLTAAYRLLAKGMPSTVFEASNRFGGRMFTVPDFYRGLFCELGGEFVDSKHAALHTLVSELGLSLERLQAQDDTAEDLYYFGGAVRRNRDLLDPATGRGAFVPIAKAVAADNAKLLDAAKRWTAFARQLDRMSLEAYILQFQGKTENWVLDVLRVAYWGEFGLPPADQSALNMVDMIGTDASQEFAIFGDSDEAFRIKGGSSQVIDALLLRLQGKCDLKLGFQLTSIARQKEGSFQLGFEAPGGTRATHNFDAVILALPFTQLRTVSGVEALGLSSLKLEAIQKLGYGNNAKLMCGTKSRSWREKDSGLPAPSNGSFLTDLPFQSVWDTSRAQPGEAGVLTNFLAGEAATKSETETYQTLAQGLRALSPAIAESLDADAVSLFQWSENPFTKGSYASARPGQYTRLLDVSGKSEFGGLLQFAGEHTSRAFLGFMNGAVESGNRAAVDLASVLFKGVR